MKAKIISAIGILALTTLACGFSIDLPKLATPGPEVTDQINVPLPTSGETKTRLEFGAGELKLSPGAPAGLVEGTAIYSIPDLKPEVTVENGNVLIRQGEYSFNSVPDLTDIKNKWELKLGNAPMDLTITAGAYKAEYEFGDLALTSLTIKDGAADVNLSFSSPNLTDMSVMRYETGASSVDLKGLANANFNTLIFQSGAGDYTLDFSGALRRDATITISSGLSNVILHIPNEVNAAITIEGGLTNVSIGSSWSKNENYYAQHGSGPTLTFLIKMGAGNLTLTE
jgi:hypothetical protein